MISAELVILLVPPVRLNRTFAGVPKDPVCPSPVSKLPERVTSKVRPLFQK